jgi:hypothetical protein
MVVKMLREGTGNGSPADKNPRLKRALASQKQREYWR